ncbi:MAG: OmpA family protein [Candidatus Rokubacteria bacterium]|nr:OmpA family protein [Candidatus Rokubacteria bacterium]
MRQTLRIGIMLGALLVFLAGCAAIDWVHDKAVEITSQPHEPDSSQSREGGPGDTLSPAAAVNTPAPAPADGKARAQGKPANVQFGFDKWDLDQAAQAYLLVLVKKLRDNPKLTVELQGYADSVGSREYNLKLSEKRVETVRRYLVERGVDTARIRSAGVGQLADGGTPEEQAKNRRVTVKLMAPKD